MVTSVLEDKVLVMNKSWMPITTVTVRRAMTMSYQDTAQFIHPETYEAFDFDSWMDAADFAKEKTKYLQGAGWAIAVPEIMILKDYKGINAELVKFSRRNIFYRDSNICQYCAKKFRTHDLTIDHVLPKSRGGISEWKNVALACYRCNSLKDNRTPKEAEMPLLKHPKRPLWSEMKIRGTMGVIPKSCEAFLGDMYWNKDLKE